MVKIAIFFFICCVFFSYFKAEAANISGNKIHAVQKEHPVLSLSKRKFVWMANRQVDSLFTLLDDDFTARQEGVKLDKRGQLDLVKNAIPTYSSLEVVDTDIQQIDELVILLTNVRLVFIDPTRSEGYRQCTEVYKWNGEQWKMIFLAW